MNMHFMKSVLIMLVLLTLEIIPKPGIHILLSALIMLMLFCSVGVTSSGCLPFLATQIFLIPSCKGILMIPTLLSPEPALELWAAATLMIYEGQNNEAVLKDTVKISSGLGFIDHCIIDTHFVRR